jgi:SAM-dependent MidA family methyltransferase
MPGMSTDLPAPEPDALAHSERLLAAIHAAIDAGGGWISFARYMELALYAPGLGYYTAGSRKLGRAGDFVTAPEITPLFGGALARQVADLLLTGLPDILEVGAGTGALAASLLRRLEELDALPAHYQILELSADLRERERNTLAERVPHLLERVEWLNQLPPGFEGVVLGNEVLDAMPVEIVRWEAGGSGEQAGVTRSSEPPYLALRFRPLAPGVLAQAVAGIAMEVPAGTVYQTEIALVAQGFLRSLAEHVHRGVCLFIDYGFPALEYYHPQRAQGTLMCHYRHRAHSDPFLYPGLQDITAHVDFSAVARVAQKSGFTLEGYTSQAHFLINCGLTELLASHTPADAPGYLPAANAVQQLLSPAEMGELFKVIALSRGWTGELAGFARGNRIAALL